MGIVSGGIVGVIDTAKEAVQLVQKIDNIELYQKILDLQADALKIVDENNTLRDKIKALEQAFAIKDILVFEDNSYFVLKESTLKIKHKTIGENTVVGRVFTQSVPLPIAVFCLRRDRSKVPAKP